MSETDFVRVEHEGALSVLTMNRPDKMNALSPEVLADLRRAIEAVDAREETRVAILTGAGRAFVAGADIAAMVEMSFEEALDFAEMGHAILDLIEALRVPVIAAVNGFALGGGCELALACDFIYASEKAKFGQPEVGLGVTPGFGGTQRLTRRVGIAQAREMLYTGAMMRADEAARIGLVNQVVAPDALMDKAREVALSIAANGPGAVAATKKVIWDGADIHLSDANRLEVRAFADLFRTRDQKEGMTAFLEKRAAAFEGK